MKLTIDFQVIFTPLGRPVLPLVYNIQAKSPETVSNLVKDLISPSTMSDIFKIGC